MTSGLKQTGRAGRKGTQNLVLVRPRPLIAARGRGLKSGLEDLGFRVSDLALLRHRLLSAEIRDFRADSLLFSSATAVDALALSSGAESPETGSFGNGKIRLADPRTPCLCVGRQTARAAREFGFSNLYSGDGGLVSLFEGGLPWLRAQLSGIEPGKKATLTYIATASPKYDIESPAFAEMLHRETRMLLSGFKIQTYPLYETLRNQAVWQDGHESEQLKTNLIKIQYLCFFSRANAASFAEFLKVGGNAKAAGGLNRLRDCLGKVTAVCTSDDSAQALSGLAFKSVRVTAKPGRESFVGMMKLLMAG